MNAKLTKPTKKYRKGGRITLNYIVMLGLNLNLCRPRAAGLDETLDEGRPVLCVFCNAAIEN